MICLTCQNKGIVKLNFQDGEEYGLCLCRAGEDMRRNQLWELWCAREGVDPATVSRIEDVLTAEELAERGFRELTTETAVAAIARVARARGTR